MTDNSSPIHSRTTTRRQLLKQAAGAAIALGAAPVLMATAAERPKAPHALPPIPADAVKPRATTGAIAFDPADVRLLDGPFKAAQDRDGAYLLFLEPDRLLHNFRLFANLPPKAEIYGGWESLGVGGHTLGHYLSACALMYRFTGDARYRGRVDYIVSELEACQKQSASGLICGIPDAASIFAKIAADGTVTGWVPWYTIHKLLAGLRDAYYYCGNSPARDIMLRLTDWAVALTLNLTYDQFQRMLDTEHGGMAETSADAYSICGDDRYLDFALRFTHRAIMDPLARGEDRLDGLHSNTNIPKLIGYERIFQLTGDPGYHAAALFFWRTVVENRSYANGGNGDFEHFFPPERFGDHVHSDCATETCCSYNMLKLTKQQFQADPDSRFMDYYERTLYNHILASQEPDRGMMCYFTPMKAGHFKVYCDPVGSFWCCVGTGIENHARYGESIYFRSPDADAMYVNLFIPSVVNWRERGIAIRQETAFPDSDASALRITADRPTAATIKIRRPNWSGGMSVSINGKAVAARAGSDGYVAIQRTWRTGDVVAVHVPMALEMQPLPNAPDKQAVMVGPVLLVGRLGVEGMDNTPDISTDQAPYGDLPAVGATTFVTENGDAARRIKPIPGQPLTFRTHGLGEPDDVTLIPMYRMHHERYNVYWSTYTPTEWRQREVQIEAEAERRRAIDAITVDEFLPGNQQSEVDHRLASSQSNTGYAEDRTWRDATAGGWFSFEMKVDPAQSCSLLCTYWGSDTGNRDFDILVDGVVIASQTLNGNSPGKMFDVAYKIPPDIVAGKQTVTVRLRAKPGAMAGGLFGCRVLRGTPTAPTRAAIAD
jgi:hypothetical protein